MQVFYLHQETGVTLKKLLVVLRMVFNNPLNKQNRPKALFRFFRWQIGSWLVPGKVLIPWVNGSRIFAGFMMSGSAGCAYSGLYEFEEMAFALHFLRKDDLFVDIGANVGVFTVLAGSAIGTRCISVEPGDKAYNHLLDNVTINQLSDRVQAIKVCASDDDSSCYFVNSHESTLSHIASTAEQNNTSNVATKRIDTILAEDVPVFMKIDVEGYEKQALMGAVNTLKSTDLKVILIEVGEHSWRYNIDPAEIHKLLSDSGFRPYRYNPFARTIDPADATNREPNSLYIRDEAFVADRLKNAPEFSVLGQSI
jgi:FkbM family methyltransferase